MLSHEQLELRATFRRFAEREIAPNAAEADERAEFPWKSFEAYRDLGFVSLGFPEAFGGDGGDTLTYALLVEEVARVCASSSLFVFISKLGDDADPPRWQPGAPGARRSRGSRRGSCRRATACRSPTRAATSPA